MRVAAVQHDIVWEDRAGTLDRVAPLVATAAEDGARLILLPEMFAVGFTMTTDRVAEPPDGPTTSWLVEQASRHGVWLGGSVPERLPASDRPRNVFVLSSPAGDVHRYAKVHPFSYSGEHEHYDAGSELVTIDVEGVRVTPFVCYDLRFADEFWQTAHGTDLYVVVANWPAPRHRHWEALLPARAIENQAYVAGVNRIGRGGKLPYAGGSCIVDPLGEVLVDAGDDEVVVAADVDPATVAEIREKFPFLRDRR